MAAPRSLQFDTLSLHAGQRPDPVTGARAVPIYFTTSFVFRDADHAAALFNMERGGHVYSHNLLSYTLPRFGIETTFVAPRDLAAWKKAIRPNTKLLFGETLGNPGLDVLDIPNVAAIAHEARLPLLVDATFTTPYLLKPFDHGADLVYHSATKFLGGHGVAIGGRLVDGRTFDWEASGRFPGLP